MKQIYAIFFSLLLSSAALAEAPATSYESIIGEPFLTEFNVYPNPTNGPIAISYEATDPTQVMNLKIYNLIGQEMYKESFAPASGIRKVELQLDDYPKGIYMIEISDGQKKRIKRISVI